MPNPTNSRKGIKLRCWQQEDMEKALKACREDYMPIATAAKEYGIPRMTLADRLKDRVPDDCPLGGPTALSKEHEEVLCKYIEVMALKAFPLTINHVLMYAWYIDKTRGKKAFGEKGLCYTWWIGFKQRHPEAVKLRRPETLDKGRVLFSSVDNLRSYFQLLKEVLDSNNFHERPEDIYNCDESGIDLNRSTKKVIVPRRMKSSQIRQVAGTEHISINCCISAAGTAMPPFIIFKNAFPGGNYTLNGPEGALYGKQDSGFMDSELFLRWFKKIFIRYAKPTKERNVLLLLDGHISHCSPDLIDCANENNVILLALAPHTTHICQPLDVSVYKSLKANIDKLVRLGQVLRGNLWIAKKDVPRVLRAPFENSMTISNIKSGFRKCGIHPFNPNAIDKTQLMRNKVILNLEVDLSLPPAQRPEIQMVSVATQTETNTVPEESPVTPGMTTVDESSPATTSVTVEATTSVTVEASTSTENSNFHMTLSPSSSQVMNPKKAHPLVEAEIISEEFADMFSLPEDEIPKGRKRPLRIQSKARVMTSDEVREDINNQKRALKDKEKGKMKKIKTSTEKELRGLNENNCYKCLKLWDQDLDGNKPFWVGCEECNNWSCTKCLPKDFNYKFDYLCESCE